MSSQDAITIEFEKIPRIFLIIEREMNARQFRLIALDLDGTVLNPAGKVSARTNAAIQRVQQMGVQVCFATGRNLTESMSVLRETGHFGPGVFAGGSLVVDPHARTVLHRTLVPADLAAELCEALESSGHAVLALQDTFAAGVDYLVSDDLPHNKATDHWMHVTSASIRRISKLTGYQHEHTVRIGIVAPREEVAAVQREIRKRFAGRVNCLVLRVPAAGVDVLEVFDATVSKWKGVMEIARRHGITGEQIIAAGDDLNDVAMITHAGLGLAMGNAADEVKSAADRTIGTHADDGLAEFLEEFVASHAAHSAA